MDLDFSHATRSIIPDRSLEKIRGCNGAVIFGAGNGGSWVYNFLRDSGIDCKCFCDNYQGKQGSEKFGLKVLSFVDAIKAYPESSICVATAWAGEILNQVAAYDKKLLDKTFDLLNSMAWETSLGAYTSSEVDFIHENYEKFLGIYEALEDQKSRDVLEGILQFRLCRNKDYIAKIKSDSTEYLDPEIFDDGELEQIAKQAIIDGGAFDGDTAEQFASMLGKYASPLKMHCFEVDPENLKRLRAKTRKEELAAHDITVHDAALWHSSDDYLKIRCTGLSSCIQQLPENDNVIEEYRTVCSARIDDCMFPNLGFVKFDIEGAERNALMGGGKTIANFKPALAICAYHLQDDIIVLYDIIKKIRNDYKIYLRHYNLSGTDTIMYAK